MIFYHGTTEENWEAIQEDGVLWGPRVVFDSNGKPSVDFHPARCTYLAADEAEAWEYGSVVLRVEYDPTIGVNNYCDGCWQLRVYDPIPVKNLTRILTKTAMN